MGEGVQVSAVHAQATAHVPSAELPAGGGVGTDVVEHIGRYECLLALVE